MGFEIAVIPKGAGALKNLKNLKVLQFSDINQVINEIFKRG